MRIIAGEWRGVKIFGGDYRDLRPLTDRIKESLFGILGDAVVGARVLDLYAGVGSFGLEALSRGAAHVVFVEKANKVVELLRRNLQKVRCSEDRYQIIREDVWRTLSILSGRLEKFEIIFADPPFRVNVGNQLLQSLSESQLLSRKGIFILRHHYREEVAEQQGDLRLWREKKYGDSVVKFYLKAEEDDNSHLSGNV